MFKTMRHQTINFQTLSLGAIRPTGWMLKQLQNDLTHGFAGCIDSLTEHAANDLFAHRIASSTQQFAWWDSETRGNWLWGYTMMAWLAGLPGHQERVNELVQKLKNTQDADGYIGIYSRSSRYQHGDGENGELWGQGRALLCLLSHYELTGDESSLRTAQAAADLTMREYGPHSYFRKPLTRNELTGMTHGLCFVDVMEWLYAITGDDRYRNFGVWLYQDFNRMQLPFPNDDMALTNLLNRTQYFNGHAVHTAEHLRALLFAIIHGNLPQAETALQNAIWKLQHYTLPSGAVIGDEGIHGQPLPDIGYEYCTLTEMLFSLTSALQKLGDTSIADWVESLTFNAAQGARFADGTGLAYLSLDNRASALNDRADSYSHLHEKHGRFKYSPTHEDVACCCNPNAVRLLPHYISRMWMGHEKGIAAVLYGPCVLKTKINNVDVTITEETNYPFEDSIRFTVNPRQPQDFELVLRKPIWSKAVTIDGAQAREEDGWLVISKTWNDDDSFTITFHPQVEATPYPNGEYAVRRGPLQYVFPIEHQLHSIKNYPLEEFHDYEITPVDIEQAYQPVILDGKKPDYGLTFKKDSATDTKPYWDQPAVRLEAGSYHLVPMGCTVLRRASFPMKR
jgi:uncharacterized protein